MKITEAVFPNDSGAIKINYWLKGMSHRVRKRFQFSRTNIKGKINYDSLLAFNIISTRVWTCAYIPRGKCTHTYTKHADKHACIPHTKNAKNKDLI